MNLSGVYGETKFGRGTVFIRKKNRQKTTAEQAAPDVSLQFSLDTGSYS